MASAGRCGPLIRIGRGNEGPASAIASLGLWAAVIAAGPPRVINSCGSSPASASKILQLVAKTCGPASAASEPRSGQGHLKLALSSHRRTQPESQPSDGIGRWRFRPRTGKKQFSKWPVLSSYRYGTGRGCPAEQRSGGMVTTTSQVA
jgi:hypothetical protein